MPQPSRSTKEHEGTRRRNTRTSIHITYRFHSSLIRLPKLKSKPTPWPVAFMWLVFFVQLRVTSWIAFSFLAKNDPRSHTKEHEDRHSYHVSLPFESSQAAEIEEQAHAFARRLHVVQNLPLVFTCQPIASF